ncbi:Rep protein [Staphylococcus massiliensis]|nr:Rep protein [Staphylococcus massiliensis]MCG3413597.1 Rep protein [Staphylococcus massiliensis]
MVSFIFLLCNRTSNFYHWNQKEYLASEIFDLTEEEKSKINHQMIDEIDEEI